MLIALPAKGKELLQNLHEVKIEIDAESARQSLPRSAGGSVLGVAYSLVLSAAVGSLLVPLAISPQVYQLGVYGFSGLAHGLAAISVLEMLRHKSQKRLSELC